MTHSASSFADNTGRALGHRTWLRNAVNGLFFYLAPTIIFFLVVAIGLWRLPGDFWGMYGNDDGMWAAWNLRGIFEWSRPFDLAPFNPLSGMGSTFFPNTPWLNPAALALALPLPREVCYLISYFVYFVELSLSLVLLFRVIGLAPLEAIICAQLYLLILFPPTNGTFVTLQWYSILPVKAYLVAICNVLLVLILIIGRYRFWTNVICGIGIVFPAHLRDFLLANHIPYLRSCLCRRRGGSHLWEQARCKADWMETRGHHGVGGVVMARGCQGLFARYRIDIGSGGAIPPPHSPRVRSS